MIDFKKQTGGIWIKKSKQTGTEYFFIKINVNLMGKERVLFFKGFANNMKQPGENTPDWKVYQIEDMEETSPRPPKNKVGIPVTTTVSPSVDIDIIKEEVEEF